MGKPSRDKGARREREIVNMHKALGCFAERVPLSGASRYKGNGSDVDVYVRGKDAAPWIAEVKARASGEGFATLDRWLGENDILFLMRDRADPTVLLTWSRWCDILEFLGSRKPAAPAPVAEPAPVLAAE